ncbi:MAG: hypothetical protein IKA31_01575 [Clostridia bacterium]|nr:hypothetical protein [Clostridia bacterium]
MQGLIELSLQNEKWLPIINFPEYYISNLGRVYSNKCKKFLTNYINSSGYLRVGLYKNNIRKQRFIHMLVVEHFGDCNGNKLTPSLCPDGKLTTHGISIDHLNRNKYNNSQENLEIISHYENQTKWRYIPKPELEDCLPF